MDKHQLKCMSPGSEDGNVVQTAISLLHPALPALQRYTIRDLNTGQLYALNNDASPHSSGNIDVGGPERVTDLISGQELSLDEFEAALGLSAVLDVSMHAEASTGCVIVAAAGVSAVLNKSLHAG